MQITTNDPVHSIIDLHLLAFVEVLFGVEPDFITFGQVHKKDTPVHKQAKLIGFKLPELKITTIESTNPMFEAKLLPRDDDEKTQMVELILKKDTPVGAQQARITVFTDSPEYQTQFSVTAVVQGNTRVQPQRVIFRTRPGQLPPKQTVRVRNMIAQDFHVENVEIIEDIFPPLLADTQAEEEGITYLKPSVHDLDISIVPSRNKGIVVLELNLKRSLQDKERLQGLFRVTTSDPDDKIIDIHYFVFTQDVRETSTIPGKNEK